MYYLFYMVQITVRDVDSAAFREFKAVAVERGIKLGVALSLAMEKFKGEFLEKKQRFTHLKPVYWGKGTERVSEEVDKILYGE